MKIVWQIKPYCHKTWDKGFKQLALLPCPYFTYNPQGSFIDHGCFGKLFVISMNFLAWDFGIMIKQELE
jgi:hypothetical protein